MESKLKRVAAVVVTYNRKALLRECLDALMAQEYPEMEILVIDNGSGDGTGELVRERYQAASRFPLRYYNTGRNLGGAGGFNFGMKKAMEGGCGWLWLLDDDCIVRPDSLKALMREAEGPGEKAGFLCSRVLWQDGSLCRMNIPWVSYREKISETERGAVPVIMATFVSFLVSRKRVEEFGFPISDFFIWADDMEYSRRISRKYPGRYAGASQVLHKTRTNIGSNLVLDAAQDLSRYRYAYRNEYYVYRREGLPGRLFYFAKRMFHRAKILLKSDRKRERLRILNRAVREGKRFRPGIETVTKSAAPAEAGRL